MYQWSFFKFSIPVIEIEGRRRIFIQALLKEMQVSPTKMVTEVQSVFPLLEGMISLTKPTKKSKLLQKIIFKVKHKKDATPIKGFIESKIYGKN